MEEYITGDLSQREREECFPEKSMMGNTNRAEPGKGSVLCKGPWQGKEHVFKEQVEDY